MKANHLKIFSGLVSILFISASCTKVNRSDDFPPGDVPPVAGGYTAASQVAASNLVAYWSFNGNMNDSVSGAVGTNSGMSFSEGIKGQALTGAAPANKAYATAVASDAIKNLKAYSISLWVNTAPNVGATGLVSIGHTAEFWANVNIFLDNGPAGVARFKTIFRNNNNTPANYQADNGIQDVSGAFDNWTNYIITYDEAGVVRSYVNGSLAATKTGTPVPTQPQFSNVGPIVFGALHFMTVPSSTTGSSGEGWAGYLSGKLDEVRIFNKSLSPIEVSAIAILERRGQ
ncbi:LamG domain-containing protein [Niabella ginsengisoli]|uniref:LamG domain-containing protein n=1 Tax=Niabella ginsengisoli TaxID=522298 RepID=A0ABS9SMS3_9BACT|nr:LamG domain-containing protein [Niabella ginsengisoli]MCH5599660.1 LamG domain-containing protein [Niabella ginsengisoli]